MDTVHPVTQQRWMDALLAATVSKEKQRPLLDISKLSGYFNSTNLNPSQKNSSRFTSKNPGETNLGASIQIFWKWNFITNRYRIPIVKRFEFDSSSATRIHTTRATSWHTRFFQSNNTNDRYGYRASNFCPDEWIIIII